MSLDSKLCEECHDDERNLIDNEMDIYDPKRSITFHISENFWLHLSWPLELARRLVTYKYTIPVFDVVYASMILSYLIIYIRSYTEYFDHNYFEFDQDGDGMFFIFFIVATFFNTLAPPLTLRLMRDMFTDEAIPPIVETAMRCDPYFRFKMCAVSYLNVIGALVMVSLSVFVTDLYDKSTLPFIVLYSFPVACAISVVVLVLDAYRLLQLDFIQNVLLLREDEAIESRTSFTSAVVSTPVEYHNRDELASHVVDIRVRFLTLHKQLHLAGQNWGRVFLIVILGFTLYVGYLVALAYKLEDISIGVLIPYIAMGTVGLCEVVVSLSLVNETGGKVKRELARHVLEYAGRKSLQGDSQDITVLLACAETLPLEIHFVEGFSLKVRLAAAIMGPIVIATLPRLASAM